LDAIGLGLKTHVIAEGCRGIDLRPGDVLRAIEEMKERGAVIV
jgi:nicotinamidase/pyrazinamidase